MNARFPRLLAGKPVYLSGLLVLLFIVLVLMSGASYVWVRADGGFPTATPTITPTPTPTNTPLPTFTPTFTPTATVPVVAPILTPTVDILTPPVLIVTQTPPLGLPTEPPPEGRPAALFCWPFALAFILIIIIVGSILFGRNRMNGVPPPPP